MLLLALDFHHYWTVFESDKLREGTLEDHTTFDRITVKWIRKNIAQKLYYFDTVSYRALSKAKTQSHGGKFNPLKPAIVLMIGSRDRDQAVFEFNENLGQALFQGADSARPHG
jgi:hypothetical protein